MCSNSESGVLRKGPPEAVSQICRTSLGCAAAEALVDGVVLGVDRQQVHTTFACSREDEIAGGDEALLVGKADGLAGEHCSVGSL